jgi:hypothetical protein
VGGAEYITRRTALAFAIARVFLDVDQLSHAQQRCDLRLQLGLGFEHPLIAHAQIACRN